MFDLVNCGWRWAWRVTEFESKIINSKKPYIFCSHALEYIHTNSGDLLKPYDRRIFCLFSVPDGSNKLIYNRAITGPWAMGELTVNYQPYTIKQLYTKEPFAEENNINPDFIFTIDTDLFYSIQGYDYLYDTIKTNLGIELPESCRKMHTQYIEYTNNMFGKGWQIIQLVL